MSLTQYRAKRHFNRTPEPEGRESKSSDALRFVVQKHDASRLHFDFRLELGGTLKSWAVPKGPSLDPADKRLAIMVEDHPLDYRTFEGTIPVGNYGAGTVMVWDEGTYTAKGEENRRDSEKALKEGLERGHLSFMLEGSKLHGEFSLLKLRRGKENEWLLVKKDDEFAQPGNEVDQHSVQSGRSLEEIAEGVAVRKKRALSPKRKQGIGGDSKKTTKKNPQPVEAAEKRAPVKPMLATLVDQPFDRKGWYFEVKWDGYRAIAEIEDGEVRLYSRNNQPFESKFAPIVAALKQLGRNAVLDGEAVVLDAEGKSQFQLLQNYQKTGRGQLIYYVFDLLALDGKDLREEPLQRRKELLQKLIAGSGAVRLSEHVENDGVAFFAAAAEQGLEGIIAKDSASRYREGVRNNDWLKIKTHMRQEAVIAGYTRPKGTRQDLGALVLGVYDGDEFIYVGHTGGGFDSRGLKEMRARLEPLRRRECPFSPVPRTNAPAQWVKPTLVCEIKFHGWTDSNHMRQPIFVGMREDKEATAVHKEMQVPVKEAVADHSQNGKAKKRQAKVVAAPASLKLTHPDKIYWPDEGVTKGQLIEYYRSVAEVMLPYLKDRPESLHRHPNGIKGSSFFQKDTSSQPPPAFVQTTPVRLEHEKREIIMPLCQNEESLLYLANLGCIEINPWNSRIESPDLPDYLVVDLDPEDTPFPQVIETARTVRKVLDNAGAESYCKTSGKRGLHVYVPLGARYDYDQARQFAELIANIVNRKLPETTSVVRSPSKRQKRVYLDFLQNRRGQTLAAPYSARPYPGATVSTPLKWSEVSSRLDPSRFTILTIPKRLDKVGDIWKPVLGKGMDLEACLDRLEKLA